MVHLHTPINMPEVNTPKQIMNETKGRKGLERMEGLSFIWVGRFLRSGGYGVATRSMYRALRESGIHILGIDVDTNTPIDDSAYPHFVVSGGGNKQLVIESTEKDRSCVIVYHETPLEWHRLEASGKCHVAGYTVTETEQIPFSWTREMLAMDQLWVASNFNKKIFCSNGVPKEMISVIPHSIDSAIFKPSASTLPMAGTNSFRYLCIVSNFNRKDVAGVIRSYCESFTNADDVSLVIKLPAAFGDEEYKKYIAKPLYPWVDLKSKNIPHIVLLSGNFTDEKIVELYKSCHVYVSLERGKGWDLPTMEAMMLGLPCIGVEWGGNTEFQNSGNSIMIPPDPRTVFSNADLVLNEKMYAGHTWANLDISKAAHAYRDAHDHYDELKEKVRCAWAELDSNYSLSAVSQKMIAYAEQLEPYQFKSSDCAKIVLQPRESNANKTDERRFVAFESLPIKEQEILNQKWEGKGEVDDWVLRRRRIWGKFGPVLPAKPDLDRIKVLRNRYFGESIFVVGNGPSLNKVNFDLLKNHYAIAANKIYLLFDRCDWRPDFYTTLDWRVTPDNYEEINRLTDMTFLFPHRFKGLLRGGEDVFWYESLSPGRSVLDRFEPDINRGVRGGGTVLTAALQQAYYLGFRKFFLLGVDVNYKITESVIQSGGDRFGTGIQVNLESTADDDPNHFDPRYFGKGAKWHDPNVNEMLRGFLSAARAIQYLGGEIYNSTIGGNLNCIQRMSIEEAATYAKPKF